MNTTNAVCDGWRDGSAAARGCMLCGRSVPSRKARYCSRACQQRAYRLRQDPTTSVDEAVLRRDLRRRGTLVAHTLYECPTCPQRYLGERRCEDCNRFCRALGLGGCCSECETPLLLSELLELEVTTYRNPAPTTAWRGGSLLFPRLDGILAHPCIKRQF